MPGPQRNAYAKPKNAKHTFLRLMRYLKKYSGLLAIIIPSLIISSAASVLGTYLLKPLFNQIAALFEQGGSSMLPVLGTVLALAGIYVLGALGTFVGNRLLINVATGILKTVRCEMFERLQALPLKYFDTRTHGEIMSRFTNDTDAMREMLGQGLPQLIVSTISVIGVLTMMFVLTPLLTLIVLVMFVLMLFIVKFIGKRSAHFFSRRQAALAAANGYVEEMIEGQREVKVFCHEEKVQADFSVLSEGLRRDSTAAMTFAMILMPIMGNLSYVLYAVSSAAGAGLAIAGLMDLGTIAAYDISPVMMELFGLRQPAYFQFLGRQLRAAYRANTRGTILEKDGTASNELTPLQQKWSDEHWLLQYDLMFGKGYALSRMGLEELSEGAD